MYNIMNCELLLGKAWLTEAGLFLIIQGGLYSYFVRGNRSDEGGQCLLDLCSRSGRNAKRQGHSDLNNVGCKDVEPLLGIPIFPCVEESL
jgi:hypothetical protein